MKKTRNYFWLIILLSAMFIFAALAAEAQIKKPTLEVKVGDRVEVNGISPSKGTVTEIGNGKEYDKSCYRIRGDRENASSQGDWVCSWGNENFIFLLDANDERVGDVYGPKKAQPTGGNNQQSSTANKNTDQQDQNNTGEYKVGDRVEILVGGKWFPATVTRGLESNSYGVVQDRWIGKGVYDANIKPYDAPTPSEIRALNDGSQSPVAPAMPAMRKPVKCPEQPNARGGAIPLALAKQLIQCLWEEMSTERDIINFDLRSVQIGAPRPWKESWSGRDMGTGIPGKTLVYPVKGNWTKEDFAADGSEVTIVEQQGVHNCYIDAFNKWKCGLGESKDLKPLQTISK